MPVLVEVVFAGNWHGNLPWATARIQSVGAYREHRRPGTRRATRAAGARTHSCSTVSTQPWRGRKARPRTD